MTDRDRRRSRRAQSELDTGDRPTSGGNAVTKRRSVAGDEPPEADGWRTT